MCDHHMGLMCSFLSVVVCVHVHLVSVVWAYTLAYGVHYVSYGLESLAIVSALKLLNG